MSEDIPLACFGGRLFGWGACRTCGRLFALRAIRPRDNPFSIASNSCLNIGWNLRSCPPCSSGRGSWLRVPAMPRVGKVGIQSEQPSGTGGISSCLVLLSDLLLTLLVVEGPMRDERRLRWSRRWASEGCLNSEEKISDVYPRFFRPDLRGRRPVSVLQLFLEAIRCLMSCLSAGSFGQDLEASWVYRQGG